MDPLAVLLVLFIPSATVAAKLLLAALYRRRVGLLMREEKARSAAPPAARSAATAGPAGSPRPDAAEVQRWVAATRRRRGRFLLVCFTATLAYAVPGALVQLLYVEPGRAPPLALLVASALLELTLLPALIAASLRGLSAAGLWTQATIFGLPIGASLAVGGSSLFALPTPGMVLVSAVSTCLLAGLAFVAALLYLRLRVALHERVGAGPSPLRFIEAGLLGAIFAAVVAGAYGNPRAWGLLGPCILLLAVLGGGLRLLATGAPRGAAPSILLLRVFGTGRTAEALLRRLADRLSAVCALRWVSSSDVAAATVSPRGMLAYLTGRLRDRFVATEADLDRALGEGTEQYLDGSFPAREIACFENGWRPVVERLIREASVVLMDLRGFTAANRGCEHELQLLADLVPASQVFLIVDATTDETWLSSKLDDAWRAMRAGSPNRAGQAGRFRNIFLSQLDSRAAAALADEMLRAVTVTQPP